MSKFDQSVRKTWGEPVKAQTEKPIEEKKGEDKKEKKDKKEAAAPGGKNAKQSAKEERLKKRQAEVSAKDEFKKDPNDTSAH